MQTSLEYFFVVARERSMKKAAEKLFLSPQNLSNHMKRLEEQYGLLYFRRPQFALTPTGEALLESIRKIRMIERDLSAQALELAQAEQGILHIGLNNSRARTILPHVIPAFRERYPHVKLCFHFEDTSVLEQMLVDGELDLFLGVDAALRADFELIALQHEPIYFIASKGMLLERGLDCENGAISPADVIRFPLLCNPSSSNLQRKLNAFWAMEPFTPEYSITIGDFELQMELAAANQGACFCPGMLLSKLETLNKILPEEQRLCYFSVENLTESSVLSLVLHKNRFRPEHLKLFSTIVSEAVAGRQTGKPAL